MRSRYPASTWMILASLFGSACSSEPIDARPGGPDLEALLPQIFRLTTLFDAPGAWTATALDFNPEAPGELWATLRQPPPEGLCTMSSSQESRAACAALPGEVAIISRATSDSPQARTERDGNAWHFMRRPTSIAFGERGTFATCGEARTGNYQDERVDFHGPVLWSSDPTIFGAVPKPGQNGTHLDMLHSTPFCMGIAHEVGNVYWAFNGQVGALDRYDFKAPHVVGGDHHADGELLRYAEGELRRVPEVPSHLVFDQDKSWLYVADTGNARVLRLDIRTGSPGADVAEYDGMQLHRRMQDAELVSWVFAGELELPSGIALFEGILLVSDTARGTIHAFNEEGRSLRSLDTGLGSGRVSGIAVGPDRKLYLSDLGSGQIYRVDAE